MFILYNKDDNGIQSDILQLFIIHIYIFVCALVITRVTAHTFIFVVAYSFLY